MVKTKNFVYGGYKYCRLKWQKLRQQGRNVRNSRNQGINGKKPNFIMVEIAQNWGARLEMVETQGGYGRNGRNSGGSGRNNRLRELG